jgi:hypothetical protein
MRLWTSLKKRRKLPARLGFSGGPSSGPVHVAFMFLRSRRHCSSSVHVCASTTDFSCSAFSTSMFSQLSIVSVERRLQLQTSVSGRRQAYRRSRGRVSGQPEPHEFRSRQLNASVSSIGWLRRIAPHTMRIKRVALQAAVALAALDRPRRTLVPQCVHAVAYLHGLSRRRRQPVAGSHCGRSASNR